MTDSQYRPTPLAFERVPAHEQTPSNERPFPLIPVGFPAAGAVVPSITKKGLEAIRINR